jgi:hypothetical protein
MTNIFEEAAEAVKGFAEDVVESAGDFLNEIRSKGGAFDGQNEHDSEEYSEIPQEDRDNLKKYVFTTPTYFEYPLKVGSQTAKNPEQLHSVRFSILARENSRVASATNSSIRDNTNAAIAFYGGIGQAGDENDLKVVDNTEQNRLSADQRQAVALLSSGVAGAALGLSVAGKDQNLAGKGLNVLIGGALATGAGGAVIESVRTVRTLGQINLHISQPPVARYSANWENKELGALAGLSTTEFNLGDLLKAGTGVGELGLRGAIKAAANLPSQLGIGGELGASVDLASAKVANPYKEQLFTSMGFRQFAFNYKFAPKNETEYNNVRKIIDLFKYHMHPENDPTGLFLEYPSEFEIEYCYNGRRNEHLNKISSCALTDIKVTYGNQDAFTTFMGTNGAPVEINLELAFTELETLTNDRIADGF